MGVTHPQVVGADQPVSTRGLLKDLSRAEIHLLQQDQVRSELALTASPGSARNLKFHDTTRTADFP